MWRQWLPLPSRQEQALRQWPEWFRPEIMRAATGPKDIQHRIKRS